MCLGTKVWAQMCLGTNVCGHKRVWVQTCLNINVSGHKCVWAQTSLGTIVWAQVCMGINVWSPADEGPKQQKELFTVQSEERDPKCPSEERDPRCREVWINMSEEKKIYPSQKKQQFGSFILKLNLLEVWMNNPSMLWTKKYTKKKTHWRKMPSFTIFSKDFYHSLILTHNLYD